MTRYMKVPKKKATVHNKILESTAVINNLSTLTWFLLAAACAVLATYFYLKYSTTPAKATYEWSEWSTCLPVECDSTEGVQWRTCDIARTDIHDCYPFGKQEQRGCVVDQEHTKVCEKYTTPDPTPTPYVYPAREDKPSVPPAPTCTTFTTRPTIVEYKRVNATSVYFRWTTVDNNIHDYVIYYGLTKDSQPWNEQVFKSESTTLHHLPKNAVIWAKVSPSHNGCVGDPSEVVDP